MRRLHDRLRDRLAASETLLWSGRPRQGIVFRGLDFLLIPFGLAWTGAILFVVGEALVLNGALERGSSGLGSVALLVLPFVTGGLYVAVGRLGIEACQRARTVYGVTDQRVLILSGLLRRSLRAVGDRSLAHASVTERPDGRGTIAFAPMTARAAFRVAAQMTVFGSVPPMFDTIPDARAVYRLILDAQNASRP